MRGAGVLGAVPGAKVLGAKTKVPRARVLGAMVAAAAFALTMACGGSDTSSPTTPSGPCTTGPNTTTIVITAAGAVCPANITVARGAQVTFVNQDRIGHDMFSDPHPDHNDCPEINQVGHLEPGQSRQTGNLVIARVCGYHDHVLFTNTALQGKITIQ